MTAYPINLDLTGRRCAVIGGGAVAERKIGDLLAAGANVSVISPTLTNTLSMLVDERKLIHIRRFYQSGDIENYFIVICATDNPEVNKNAAREAKSRGALVNVADNPGLCDFTIPSRVVRGDLLITVSTSGSSPAVAKKLRLELEQRYGPEYGHCLELIGRLRDELKHSLTNSKQRELFWQQAIDQQVLSLIQQGKLEEAEEKIRHAIGRIGPQS